MKNSAQLTFVDRPSPNFNERGGQSVQFLVIHYTAMATAEDAIKRLSDPAAAVSAHYVVDNDGTIYRLVSEDKRAWHAGVSFWDGHSNLNASSVGIEIANDGVSPYPEAQMKAVIALSNDIASRHKLRAFYVVGHSDIAPDRKDDPGALFDWKRFAETKLGVWPAPTKDDYTRSKSWTDKQVLQNLIRLGYASGPTLDVLVTAFQRHYQPEVFGTGGKPGTADDETKARLNNLLRRKSIADGIRASRAKNNRGTTKRGRSRF